MQVRYRCRIYPSPGQRQMLARTFGCARVVYWFDSLSGRRKGRKVRRPAFRRVHDASWSQLLRLIEEKAAHYGRTFARIGRFEPTSQMCSACGGNVRPGLVPADLGETGTHRSAA